MSLSITRVAPSALLLCLLAGTAFGQTNTYSGNSPVNGNWSLPLNWSDAVPPNDGGATRIINIATAGAQNVSNVNTQNVNAYYTVLQLNFMTGALPTTITGAPIRFQGLNDILSTGTHDTFQVINNEIQLDAAPAPNGARLLFIQGAAAQTPVTGSQTGMILRGRITQDVNPVGLWINPAGRYDLIFANPANNSNFSGPINVLQGTVVIGCNSALGNGGDLRMQGVNAAIRALLGEDRSLANRLVLLETTTFGSADFNSVRSDLRFTGPVLIGATANTNRTINLRGGRANGTGHVVTFAGDVVHAANTTLEINGDVAPVMEGRRVRNLKAAGLNPASPKADNLGSLLQITGPANNFRGGVTITRATMRVDGTIATAANRVMNNWTLGDGTVANAAVLCGRGVNNGPRAIDPGLVNAGRIFLNAGVAITATKNSTLEPGASPGILAINGGGVEMEPGSNFAVTINGAAPGTGDGFYGQLVLEQGAGMHLQYNGLGEHPFLGIDLQTWDTTTGNDLYHPQNGDSFTIIDQTASWADSIYSPDSGGFGGNMFTAPDGTLLRQGALFTHEELLPGQFFHIDYYGGDGNDVVLTVVPTPGAAGVLSLVGLASLRRKRR